MTGRIDVHQHVLPDFYRDALRSAGLHEPSGRALPDWSADGAIEHMNALGIDTAIMSVSTPGVGFVDDAEQRPLTGRLNQFCQDLAAQHPERFGWFATVPMPDVASSTAIAAEALDAGADGVTLLANSAGVYLGAEGQEPLFAELDSRGAVAFVHPADLPAPAVDGIPPFAADFLLDTTRAAYLLVRNHVLRRYPNIRFVLSHAGGFVPYASHRMAVTIAAEVGRSPLDVLDDLRSFYFDTALSSSPAALPTLVAFARPERIVFGSDWPFAPTAAGAYFASGLDAYTGHDAATRDAINYANAAALLRRVTATPPAQSLAQRARHNLQRQAARAAFRLVQPT